MVMEDSPIKEILPESGVVLKPMEAKMVGTGINGTKEVDDLWNRLCAGCVADYHGGFPDFCVETLEMNWTGQGHCLRCNGILNPESFPEYWKLMRYYKVRIAEVDDLAVRTKRLRAKYPEDFALKLSEDQWQQHRAELVKERDTIEAEWKKKPLGTK